MGGLSHGSDREGGVLQHMSANAKYDYEAIISLEGKSKFVGLANASAELGRHVNVVDVWDVDVYGVAEAVGLSFVTDEKLEYGDMWPEFEGLESLQRLGVHYPDS